MVNWKGSLQGGIQGASIGASTGNPYVMAGSAIAGGIMGLFGDSSGDMLSNSKALARYNAKLNYNYNQKYALNAPTWQRSGLESAGYNPNLPFLGSGSGMGSASSFSGAPVVGSYDYNSPATNAMSMAKTLTDLKVALSQANNLDATTENTKTQTLAQLIKNKFLPERERVEIAKIVSDKVRNESESEALISNAKSNSKNAETNRINANTTIGKAIATTLLSSLGLGIGLKNIPNAKSVKVIKELSKFAPRLIK